MRNQEAESDSMASEDDASVPGGGRKEEMKKSIFGKRRSDENKLEQHKRANPFSFKVNQREDNRFYIKLSYNCIDLPLWKIEIMISEKIDNPVSFCFFSLGSFQPSFFS